MIYREYDKNNNIIYKSIYLPCDGHVELLKVEKMYYEYFEPDYVISIVDSCQHNKSGILSRLKRACKILLGKETYYGDIIVNEAKIKDFATNITMLVNEDETTGSENRNN
jgi:hypothetical protein